MSQTPAGLRYTSSHEWLRAEDGGVCTVGITDHAQAALGDLVFVETPASGRAVAQDEACAVVESVKAASDVYAPLAGEIVAGNEVLSGAPEKINQDPYGEGWIFRMKLTDPAALDGLMDAAAYAAFCAADTH
jgi:glycine cleavage system H protein